MPVLNNRPGLLPAILIALTCLAAPAIADEIASFATGGYASALRTKEMQAKIDTNQTGMITKDQWMTFYNQMFDAMDKNKSGVLEEDEFLHVQPNARFATAAYARAFATKEMFDKMDTNHDGTVSRAEFLAYHRKIFEMLDTRKQGMVGLVDFIHPAGS
jgi:hypothetical protein